MSKVPEQVSDKISCIPFKFKYLTQLKDLLASNDCPYTGAIEMRTLPKIGHIAFLGYQPIAAGFLRRLEPCYAHIDTLCSNKYFGSEVRHEGIRKVVDALIDDAKRLKLEGIIATTHDSGILHRAEALGFHIVEQKIIALPLIKAK